MPITLTANHAMTCPTCQHFPCAVIDGCEVDECIYCHTQTVRFVSETFDSGVCWQAICLDPDGNPLSLHHRYAAKDARPVVP